MLAGVQLDGIPRGGGGMDGDGDITQAIIPATEAAITRLMVAAAVGPVEAMSYLLDQAEALGAVFEGLGRWAPPIWSWIWKDELARHLSIAEVGPLSQNATSLAPGLDESSMRVEIPFVTCLTGMERLLSARNR